MARASRPCWQRGKAKTFIAKAHLLTPPRQSLGGTPKSRINSQAHCGPTFHEGRNDPLPEPNIYSYNKTMLPVLESTPVNPPRKFANGAEWLASLGNVPMERIIFNPLPGTATETDLLRLIERDKRLCELIDGTLVEKPGNLPQHPI